MIEDQLVHIEADTARLTAGMLAKLLALTAHALVSHQYATKSGAQSLAQLNRQGRALDSIEVDSAVLRDVKRQMKAYAVDFAVTRDKDTGKISLWFKGQDVERIQAALEHCIVDRGTKQTDHSKVQEVCDHAKEMAEQVNAKLSVTPPDRGERL